VKRGEIWWAELPDPRGSEPGFRRPVLVVQADALNNSRLPTVVVAAITSNLRLADAPGNVHLTRRQSELPKESVVNVSRVLTLDRRFLKEKVSQLPATQLQEVESGLRLVLSL
jgi:mRNA interferase MazF